jgi:hypothetical protein
VQRTLAEFMQDWLRRDAIPNLAPNTIASYLPAYNNHIRALPVDPIDPTGPVFGVLPLSEFAEPHIHNEFRASLTLTGRSKSNQDAAKKVLSSALSWGVESRAYRRWLPTNGAKLVTGRRRRSNRARAAATAEARLPRSRVFNAFDYELVRAQLLARTDQRAWEPHRDTALLDLQFGCGWRPEEARGARWWQVLWPTENSSGVIRVRDVVAAGEIDAGKTNRLAARRDPARRDRRAPARVARDRRRARPPDRAAGLHHPSRWPRAAAPRARPPPRTTTRTSATSSTAPTRRSPSSCAARASATPRPPTDAT